MFKSESGWEAPSSLIFYIAACICSRQGHSYIAEHLRARRCALLNRVSFKFQVANSLVSRGLPSLEGRFHCRPELNVICREKEIDRERGREVGWGGYFMAEPG